MAFEVNDGLAGFPASVIGRHAGCGDEGRRWLAADPLEPNRRALSGMTNPKPLEDADGFVDTRRHARIAGRSLLLRRAGGTESSTSEA